MCNDLAQVATFAMVNNVQYRLIKAATPGSFTFILRARRELPRNTPSYQRASDIVTFAGAEVRERAEERGGRRS